MPIKPTATIQPPSVSGGSCSRPIAAMMIQIEIATSATPFASAARISARRRPKLRCGVAGVAASQVAPSASPRLAASVTMCPASASSDSEFATRPPTISTTMKARISASAIPRRRRSVARRSPWSWSCMG